MEPQALYTVCFDTPASAAIIATVVAPYPCATKSRSAASTMRRSVTRAASSRTGLA